jgi:hypothetical protein
MPHDTFNGKPLLEFNSEIVFAELAILRSLQQADGTADGSTASTSVT